jgi:crotonobetaine/carnitine-CoA ligase
MGVMLPNYPEYLWIRFGTAKLGAVEVPINTSYKGEFPRHIVDRSDSRVLVISREFLDGVGPIQDGLKKLEKIVVLGGL